MKTVALLSVLLFPMFAHAQAGAPPAPMDKPPVVQKTASGLVLEMLQEGKGAQPNSGSTVRVHYRGMFPDGREFDSSFRRGEPIEFPLTGVIKCWTEGVAMMRVGGAARLTCPPAIAYGARGAGGVIPPNATLVFEIQLLGLR
jgi:FKBP-type peptidyl-prolyl cis-trans isomerase FkpA